MEVGRLMHHCVNAHSSEKGDQKVGIARSWGWRKKLAKMASFSFLEIPYSSLDSISQGPFISWQEMQVGCRRHHHQIRRLACDVTNRLGLLIAAR
jgi:hypothetical protein